MKIIIINYDLYSQEPSIHSQTFNMSIFCHIFFYEVRQYPGRTKVTSAALQEDIDLSEARGIKPRSQIT